MLLNPNHHAFPSADAPRGCEGLTTRELFSVLAMQALIPVYLGAAAYTYYGAESGPDDVAQEAVSFADALIARLNKS